MQKIFIIAILAFGISFAESNNIGYLQLLGPAGTYSINYERGLPFIAGPVHFSVGIGASVSNNTVIDVPLMAHAILGRRHQFEIGAGLEPEWFMRKNISDYQSIIIGSAGYRYCFKNNVMLGLAFMPMYETTTKFYYSGLGFNAGYGF